MEQVLQTKQGAVNPFSLVNDKEDKVKKVIIDTSLLPFSHWALHPVENTHTVEVVQSEFREKFLNALKKEVVEIDLAAAAEEE